MRNVSIDAPDERGDAPVERMAAPDRDPLDSVLDFERGSILAAALGELPVIHREVLALRFEEGMSLGEIAEVAGIPLSTVKSRLQRALENLRERVGTRLSPGGRS
jgi:RNA polymerase sigma-70 factor (ECF subfamily)